MLTGPSASGKTTSAHKVAEALEASGTPAHVISLDNFFKGAQYYPRLPDGTLDYEKPRHTGYVPHPPVPQRFEHHRKDRAAHLRFLCRKALGRGGAHRPAGRCMHRGGHPCAEPGADRPCKGRRHLPHLCRPAGGILHRWPPRHQHAGYPPVPPHPAGRCSARPQPGKTLAMWDRVLDGETRYIKGFKTTADFCWIPPLPTSWA